MRKSALAVAAVAAMTTAGVANAAILAEYTFGQAAPQTVAPNVTASNVTSSNLAVFNVNFTSTAYAGGATNPFLQTAPNFNAQGDPAGAYARNEFWAFTLTPGAGYFLDLDELSFTVMRGGASGTRGFAVYSSVDSYGSPLLVINDEPGTRSSPSLRSITLPASFDYLTTPVTFRFYIHSFNNATSMDFDNVRVTGEVALIPEPAALSALVLPALALLRRR